MNLAYDYYTVRYDCSHDMLRAVRVTGKEPVTYEVHAGDDGRLIYSPQMCRHCIARRERARERRTEKERGNRD